MNDLNNEYYDEVIGFDVEQYNQLVIVDKKKFLKTMIRLKNLEGEKFDEHFQVEYKGNTYLYGQKITTKNTLVLDLNDFSKIINNLSFHKSSIIRKTYISELTANVEENKVTEIIAKLMDEFDFLDNVSLLDKEVGLEKIFDNLFLGYVSQEVDSLANTHVITDLIIRYLDILEIKNALLIVDSSLKFFDLRPLIKDERILIFDTNVQYNKNTSNIILFSDFVETYQMDNIVESIEFHWPDVISKESIVSLLQVYWHIIVNDEIGNIDMPSDNLICLYIIIRKLFNLSLKSVLAIEYRRSNEKISNYITDFLLEYNR